jgi:MFS family permease
LSSGWVCVGAFIGQLDATIVQLALPTLGKAFAAPLPAVSWVALAYLVAFASFLPIFGPGGSGYASRSGEKRANRNFAALD